MTAVKMYLGGEGRNELGSRAGDPAYQTGDNPGVIETLLRRVEPSGWEVVGAIEWTKIRKFQARGPTQKEERNVRGLVEMANRADAAVASFVRDADADEKRTKTIESAIAKSAEDFPQVAVIGGAAIPVLEAWMLAMKGVHGTERLSKAGAQRRLSESGIVEKNTAAMTDVVSEVDLDRLPSDAESLRKWVARAREVLPPMVRRSEGDKA